MKKEEMRLLFNVFRLDHNASQTAPKNHGVKDPLGIGQNGARVTGLDQGCMGRPSAVENQLFENTGSIKSPSECEGNYAIIGVKILIILDHLKKSDTTKLNK